MNANGSLVNVYKGTDYRLHGVGLIIIGGVALVCLNVFFMITEKIKEEAIVAFGDRGPLPQTESQSPR